MSPRETLEEVAAKRGGTVITGKSLSTVIVFDPDDQILVEDVTPEDALRLLV